MRIWKVASIAGGVVVLGVVLLALNGPGPVQEVYRFGLHHSGSYDHDHSKVVVELRKGQNDGSYWDKDSILIRQVFPTTLPCSALWWSVNDQGTLSNWGQENPDGSSPVCVNGYRLTERAAEIQLGTIIRDIKSAKDW